MSKTKRRRVNQRRQARKGVPITLPGTQWDRGAEGEANRVGLVTEERGEIDPDTGKTRNPNGVKGARRVDTLELYHRWGWISTAGRTAGETLRDAWENTQRGPGWSEIERVQSSPKPDHAIAMQIDRITKLHMARSKVPPEYAAIIEHVALHGGSVGGVTIKGRRQFPGHTSKVEGREQLGKAFDALAESMGFIKKDKIARRG